MQPTPRKVTRQRLREIVTYVFDGNVRAAARAAGVPQPTLHLFLAGTARDLTLRTAQRLADRFGVPLTWLLGEVQDLPMEGWERATPRWRNLLMLYYERARQEHVEWIESVGAGTTDEARQVLDAFRDFRRGSSSYNWPRKWIGALEKRYWESPGEIPKVFQAAWRAQLEWENEMCALFVRQLKQLGERPR